MGVTIAPAELVEGRALTKRNTIKSTSVRTQGRVAGSFGLGGVRQNPDKRFWRQRLEVGAV